MTRNQMHNTLRYVREQLADERGEDYSGVMALDMVLEELEQEPSGDLISRQAVFEQINCWIGSGEYRYTNATHYLTERVKHIPSINPQEPKTGHWILDETDNSITCDKCGCLIWANDISNGEAYYCPNCGCRMGSEDKE